MSPPASAVARRASGRPASARSASSGRSSSARSAAARAKPGARSSAPGERRSRPAGRGAPSRRPPRRYSGPAGGIASAAAAVAIPAPRVAPRPAPARRARPAAQPQRLRAPHTRSRSAPSLAALASPRRLLELSLQGRGWIALLAFALIGIVTMQLIVLRLNTDIGRSLQQAAALQRKNAALSIEDSEADSGEKVEALAQGLGMRPVSPGQLQFRSAAGRSRAEAAAIAPGVGG